MEKQIKGLRKLSTEEMENVRGGYMPPPPIDICLVLGVLLTLASQNKDKDFGAFISAVDAWMASGC